MDDDANSATPQADGQPQQGAPESRGREIEVKLEAPPRLLRRAFELEPLAGAQPGPRRTFETLYYDTPHGALAEAGMALRVRRIGRRRLMTLKWTPDEGLGIFARGEREVAIRGDDLELGLLGPEAEKMIADAAGTEPLGICFLTRFRRRAALVEVGGGQIEAALDEGRIVAGEREAPIAELELELKRGEPAILFDLAARLTDLGFRVAPAAKGQRAHWLASGEAPEAVRASPPNLTPASTLDDAIAAVLLANLQHFVANWPALSMARPEVVHQMRVALRRLRAALGLFNRSLPCDAFQGLRAQAKNIASALGPARDHDVFADMVEEGPARALGREASFDALLAACERRREEAYAQARALIEAPRTSRFVLELQALAMRRQWRAEALPEKSDTLAIPACDFAERALDRLDRRALKRGKRLVELAPEERHEVRIALKNLRYAGDFFAPLFGGGRDARRYLRTIGALQDGLGAYNDAVTAGAIAAQLEAEAGPAAARAAGAVSGWAARGAADADAHLAAAWKRFRKAPRFWR